MRNEMVSQQIVKKRQVFTVKEKIRRRKSKILSSPVTRQRRNTEPVISELCKLKRSLRQSQENISYSFNQVPPYVQQQRQRATSIPSSYQFQNFNQNSYNYVNSTSLDQNNNSSGQNSGYSPYQQQSLPANQQNISKSFTNQNGQNQNSQNKINTHSINHASQNNTIYNSGNQREIQQNEQPYSNASSQGANSQNKNYSNLPVSQNQIMNKQNSLNAHQQIGNENNSAKGNNSNTTHSYLKQNHSSTNSINSICTNPYSASSQTDCSINHPSTPYNVQDKSQAHLSQVPTITKSNSWMGGDQNTSQYSKYQYKPLF